MRVEDATAGIQMRITNRDYGFLPEELILGAVQIWPQAGDTVTETDGTVYEVVRKLGLKESWEWFSQRKEVIRVHLQLIVGT